MALPGMIGPDGPDDPLKKALLMMLAQQRMRDELGGRGANPLAELEEMAMPAAEGDVGRAMQEYGATGLPFSQISVDDAPVMARIADFLGHPGTDVPLGESLAMGIIGSVNPAKLAGTGAKAARAAFKQVQGLPGVGEDLAKRYAIARYKGNALASPISSGPGRKAQTTEGYLQGEPFPRGRDESLLNFDASREPEIKAARARLAELKESMETVSGTPLHQVFKAEADELSNLIETYPNINDADVIVGRDGAVRNPDVRDRTPSGMPAETDIQSNTQTYRTPVAGAEKHTRDFPNMGPMAYGNEGAKPTISLPGAPSSPLRMGNPQQQSLLVHSGDREGRILSPSWRRRFQGPDGKSYDSLEQYYHANRGTKGPDNLADQIRGTSNSKLIGKLGREWERTKPVEGELQTMAEGLLARYSPNSRDAKFLTRTGSRPLVHHTPWGKQGDPFWGVHPEKGGEDVLGRMLEDLRYNLAQGKNVSAEELAERARMSLGEKGSSLFTESLPQWPKHANDPKWHTPSSWYTDKFGEKEGAKKFMNSPAGRLHKARQSPIYQQLQSLWQTPRSAFDNPADYDRVEGNLFQELSSLLARRDQGDLGQGKLSRVPRDAGAPGTGSIFGGYGSHYVRPFEDNRHYQSHLGIDTSKAGSFLPRMQMGYDDAASRMDVANIRAANEARRAGQPNLAELLYPNRDTDPNEYFERLRKLRADGYSIGDITEDARRRYVPNYKYAEQIEKAAGKRDYRMDRTHSNMERLFRDAFPEKSEGLRAMEAAGKDITEETGGAIVDPISMTPAEVTRLAQTGDWDPRHTFLGRQKSSEQLASDDYLRSPIDPEEANALTQRLQVGEAGPGVDEIASVGQFSNVVEGLADSPTGEMIKDLASPSSAMTAEQRAEKIATLAEILDLDPEELTRRLDLLRKGQRGLWKDPREPSPDQITDFFAEGGTDSYEFTTGLPGSHRRQGRNMPKKPSKDYEGKR
ncbi:NADAR family protein [Candidatus Poriferisocius sp.]|uniref:NADAR family protein n=1 Tax=Candidatus Poriferisocius sp. TaxID=3101276 RepID=UPI003B523BDD